MHLTSPPRAIISQNVPEYSVPAVIDRPDQVVLHLGSGNVPSTDPRVISLDVLPCESVDVVAEAESLPFANDTFDYVESGAVFEHVHDPLSAAREVRRVLKPGGRLRIDTAFLQAYHGFPSHYFNMTPQAVEAFLVDDFCLEQSMVPDSATPAKALLDLLTRFLEHVPKHLREETLGRPLGELVTSLRDDCTRGSVLLSSFDEFPMRAMAASYVVIGRKPEDYERRRAEIECQGPEAIAAWQELKREYYAQRLAVIQHHHEVGLYARFCRERDVADAGLPATEDLGAILQRSDAPDLLDASEINRAIARMHDEASSLIALRDRWIALYLRPPLLARAVSRATYPWRRFLPFRELVRSWKRTA
jgi:SAM-dependent methyltransferase